MQQLSLLNMPALIACAHCGAAIHTLAGLRERCDLNPQQAGSHEVSRTEHAALYRNSHEMFI